MGEYGYDHDTGEVVYHHDGGISVDSSGNEYMDTPDGFSVDLKTNEVHYSPASYSASGSAGDYDIIWAVLGVICAVACIVYIGMTFNTDGVNFFKALLTGFCAVVCFRKCGKRY